MAEAVLYGKADCHLCDVAEADLRRLAPLLGFSVVKRDIESDPDLERQYRWAIPVVMFEGVEVARAPIRPGALEAKLRAALRET